MGVLLPQCIDPGGSFNRDGSGQNPRGGIGGKAKLKTLSEALFQQCPAGGAYDIAMPCGLDWKTAAARGMLRSDGLAIDLRSVCVLAKRRNRVTRKNANQPQPMEKQKQTHAEPDEESSIDVPCDDGATSSTPTRWMAKHVVEESKMATDPSTLLIPGGREVSSAGAIEDQLQKDQHNARSHGLEEYQGASKSGAPTKKETTNKSQNRPKEQRRASVRGNYDDANSNASLSVMKDAKCQEKPSVSEKSREGELRQPVTATKKGQANGGQKSRKKNRRPVDSSSPSSMRSVSSAFSSRTDTTISPMASAAPKIRPPPGLPPPPGFGDFDDSVGLDLGISSLHAPLLSELASRPEDYAHNLSSLLPSLDSRDQPRFQKSETGRTLDQLYLSATSTGENASTSSLFNTIRATDEINLEISQSSLLHENAIDDVMDAPLPATDLGSRTTTISNDRIAAPLASSGFDVMGFLDNILEESRDENDDDEAVPALSSDPWAPGRKSRAAAYGIFVEGQDEDDEDDDDEGRGIVQAILAVSPQANIDTAHTTPVVPLLTPAAFGGSRGSVFDDYDDAAAQEEYNSVDFYAKLLGE